MKKIKLWLNENGFMGITALAIAGGAGFMGLWFLCWGSIGFFIGKNWEIIWNIYTEKYKDELDAKVADIRKKLK